MAPPIADILHRGAVLTLVGISVWGIATGYMVHKNTLKRGRGACPIITEREALGLPLEKPVDDKKKDETLEQIWAEAAQNALHPRRNSPS